MTDRRRDLGLVLVGFGVGGLAAFGWCVWLDWRDLHDARDTVRALAEADEVTPLDEVKAELGL